MKQWQQSQLILTATAVPVVLLVCWFIYKKTTATKNVTKKKRNGDSSQISDTNQDIAKEAVEENSTSVSSKTPCSSDNLIDTEETVSNDQIDFQISPACDVEKERFSEGRVNGSSSKELPVDTIESSVSQEKDVLVNIPLHGTHGDGNPESGEAATREKITTTLTEVSQPPEDAESLDLLDDNDTTIVANEGCDENLDVTLQHEEIIERSIKQVALPDILQISPKVVENKSDENFEDAKITTSDHSFEKERENMADYTGEGSVVEIVSDKNFPSNLDVDYSFKSESISSASIDNYSHLSRTNSDSALMQPVENHIDSALSDSDINTNNNNNTDEIISNFPVNGQPDDPHYSNCIRPVAMADDLHKSNHTNKFEDVSIVAVQTNGCNGDCSDKDEVASDDQPKTNDEDEMCSKKRPNSLLKLNLQESTAEGSMKVYVEFPSERVGLLIGKQGRNIKQLKQDSGADVFVHAARFRDDIQVLQICGTQSEVESCVSRIKRRFNDISLCPCDPSIICASTPNSSAKSPIGTPPPLMYPVPNISQLRLPEGVNVDVIISALASVDCVFLQQYTHPSFHGLESLERAMGICYAEPSTPCLPNPVQVGLICAASQNGMWYRAQIIQCFEDSEEILIKFMDYGGYATLPGKTIKQIRADFVTLPFQAVECYLDNIASPEENEFCEEKVNKMADMLKEGRFQARVTGYRSDGYPRIYLLKCHTNKVILINQEMAAKGIATWVEPAPFQTI